MKYAAVYCSIISMLLGGCSTYAEEFDCAPGKGVGCQSLHAVNQMVEEDALVKENPSESVITEEPVESSKAPCAASPLKIWFAGFQNAEGETTEPSHLTVLEESSCTAEGK